MRKFILSRRSLLIAAPAVILSCRLDAMPFARASSRLGRRGHRAFNPNCPICTGRHTVSQIRDARLRKLEMAERAAPVIRAQIVRPCGPGGICFPAPACTAPSFRDFTAMPELQTVIDPTGISLAVSNDLEVRAENNIGGLTYAFTETNDGVLPTGATSIATYTSTNGVEGPWTYVGVAIAPSPGSWDNANIISPTCKNIGGLWYLYYAAQDTMGNWAVGFATSTTLQPGSWTKPGSAVVSGGGQADPCVPAFTIGGLHFMYLAPGYPGGNTIQYFTSPDGITWSFGGVALAAPSMGEWDFGQHTIYEPTVILNKHCFYEMIYDTIDVHNSLGGGVEAAYVGQATSSNGTSFSRGPAPLPMGFGNCRLIEKQNELLFFSDVFPYPSNGALGGTGMCRMPDP